LNFKNFDSLLNPKQERLSLAGRAVLVLFIQAAHQSLAKVGFYASHHAAE